MGGYLPDLLLTKKIFSWPKILLTIYLRRAEKFGYLRGFFQKIDLL